MVQRSVRRGLVVGVVVVAAALGLTLLGEPGAALSADARRPGYNLSSVVILSRVLSYVKNQYYDPGRIAPRDMMVSGLRGLERNIAELTVATNADNTRVTLSMDQAQQSFSLSDVNSLWDINYKFQEVFEFVQPALKPGTEVREVEYQAINGILDTLDPHSVLLAPKVFNEMRLSTQGSFGGLGIVIGIRKGQLSVIAPYEDTPAWRAGLKPRDKILMIDGQSTINMGLQEAVNQLRGSPGTKVKLTVGREGWPKARDVELVRAIINIKSVVSALYPGRIGHVRIKNFQQNTYDDLEQHLRTLTEKAGGPLTGLVLDLRGNPGGLLEQAVRVSDKFLASGVVVSTVGVNNQRKEVRQAGFFGSITDVPIVVLVDGSSASASEIVSGALKNNDRAVVVGERTFGKGSVQMLYDFDDGSALKLTIAQYLTPGDVSIQSVGVAPDIELVPVVVSPDTIEYYRERNQRREADLEKHLDSDKTSDSRPRYSLRYLYDEERDGENIDAPPDQLKEDFHVQFAAQLIRDTAGEVVRPKVLERLGTLMPKFDDAEGRRIAASLAKLGIAWNGGENKPGAAAEATFAVRSMGPTPPLAEDANPARRRKRPAGGERPYQPRITGGDEVEVSAEFKNTGSVPLYRVRAITESSYGMLDGLELFFGEVGPGQTKKARTFVDMPLDVIDRVEPVALKWYEQYDRVPPRKVQEVLVTGVAGPKFAFSWQLDDTKTGNGNGVLDRDETAEIVVDVTNVGAGAVREGQINLRNVDNVKQVFLDKGREPFEKIEPGKTHTGRLRIMLKSGLDRTTFPLEISIVDTTLREYTAAPIELVVAPQPAPVVEARTGGAQLPAGACIRTAPAETAPCFAEAVAGTVLPFARIVNGFAQVRFGVDRVGYAKPADIVADPRRAVGNPALRMTMRTPRIAFDEATRTTLAVDAPTFRLKGQVVDDNRLQDMYIIGTNRKLLFKSNPKPDDPASLMLPFDIEVPLEPGVNAITVVGRERDKFLSSETVVVFRRLPDGAVKPPKRSASPYEHDEE